MDDVRKMLDEYDELLMGNTVCLAHGELSLHFTVAERKRYDHLRAELLRRLDAPAGRFGERVTALIAQYRAYKFYNNSGDDFGHGHAEGQDSAYLSVIDDLEDLLKPASPRPASQQEELSTSEARQLAAGLVDYAEGRTRSFKEIEKELKERKQ